MYVCLILSVLVVFMSLRFAGGVLGAKISARLMLGGGLLITALINITFGFAHSVTAFTALWFLNGSLQVHEDLGRARCCVFEFFSGLIIRCLQCLK